jgi:hypothetical protein
VIIITQIEFRYRPYKTNPGTYLLINGVQKHRISARQLSRKEQNSLREKMLLSYQGLVEVNSNTFQKQIDDDKIIQVQNGKMNSEVALLEKNENSKWEKEPKEQRDYISFDDPKKSNKIIRAVKREDPDFINF